MTEFKRIPPEQAQALREQGAVVVDVRDPQAFAANHISGSKHLDNHSLHDFIGQGFSEVYSLDGGFELWRTTYPDETAQSPGE